ncbi:MAG: SulP family inorganic anion transporter [Rhodospirillales bacterium]|jgi:sulfate permease, SulP family|nr:SulP family inorganic anion transporter [Rhodospirillales bacterium]MBT4627710.1 SulP family inorganic anion transporter [Rhodospirillales bacterium]MBT5352043.1 SulP family inorganic anion transporter [Rhodospirillales bacterium]MBT5521812.1 SulP family inorganic anion transporter [Rhodospirillales bacterium]MBT6109443.1 SulP family inorganic anion transporter [Rhodospirillales bacterium]
MSERLHLIHGLRFDNIKGDIFGGVTAAVVALPLALAFGVASGAGPLAGLWGAILVGFFAAVFGGTPAQVSGPTGPMTVVTAGIVMQYAHDPAIAFTVVMMAGAFQIAFSISGIGKYINLMPMPVVSGFMSGIGCIIIALQLAPLFGHVTSGNVVESIMALPFVVGNPLVDAAVVGLLSLALMCFLPRAVKRILPPALVALIVGTVCAYWFLPEAPVLGEIPTGFPNLTWPIIDTATLASMLQSAFLLAMLGTIDSLLTSLVADNVTQTHHRPNRELLGQGIGNMVAGLFGAIPGAGATMRTVINVRAGGRTPISGALHAVVLFAVVMGLGPLASHIPHAVLAGILIKVGFDIIDWEYLRRARRAPKTGLILMVIVLLLTVFVDLIVAVMVGLVLASLVLTKRMADLHMAGLTTISADDDDASLSEEERSILRAAQGHIMVFVLRGPFSFGAATGVTRRIRQEVDHSVLILDLSEVPMIDSSASFALEEVIRNAGVKGRHALLVGVRPAVRTILASLGVLDLFPAGHVHRERESAIRHAAILLNLDQAT